MRARYSMKTIVLVLCAIFLLVTTYLNVSTVFGWLGVSYVEGMKPQRRAQPTSPDPPQRTSSQNAGSDTVALPPMADRQSQQIAQMIMDVNATKQR